MATNYHLTIAGIISDEHYHKCLACLKELQGKGLVSVTNMQFFPTQWDAFLKQTQNMMKGEAYLHKGSPIVYLNG